MHCSLQIYMVVFNSKQIYIKDIVSWKPFIFPFPSCDNGGHFSLLPSTILFPYYTSSTVTTTRELFSLFWSRLLVQMQNS